uniref:Uncharacterized protein n=1 Tax=Arundo donax TaxID=35708 RepID=A0A0A9GMB8_ARUDO
MPFEMNYKKLKFDIKFKGTHIPVVCTQAQEEVDPE